jgi:DNA-binding response OmpR family regulator
MAKIILIADDDDNVRELVRISLEPGGYEIHEAVDGNQALKMALELKPDLMVLDIMMPGKVGYQVCEEVKKDPEAKKAFVILLSARGSAVARQTGAELGADAYMGKPFDPDELMKLVEKALG